MTVQLWRAGGHRVVPWRNGGGLTREVAVAPSTAGTDDFDWRISLAEVRRSGPFSTFTDVDRVIVLLDGSAMDLVVDGCPYGLTRYQPFPFDGASVTSARLPDGPTRDLNVMTRRGRVSAAVEVVTAGPGPELVVAGGDPLVLLALTGHLHVDVPDAGRVLLHPLDAACWLDSRPVSVSGAGRVATVRFAPAP